MFKTYLHFCILKLFAIDSDECASGVHACHKNALCINTEGSYKRVSMGLTDRRKTAKNLVDSRKN